PLRLDQRQRALGIGGGEHAVARAAKNSRAVLHHVGLVVHDENAAIAHAHQAYRMNPLDLKRAQSVKKLQRDRTTAICWRCRVERVPGGSRMKSDFPSHGATAKESMTSPVLTVAPSMTIVGALGFMRQHAIRHLVVGDDSGLQGIVSNRDYRRLLERTDSQGELHRLRETELRDIMTPAAELVTASPETPVVRLADVMIVRALVLSSS